MNYLPPLKVSNLFNVDDYIYRDGFIVYKKADHRYSRPIQKLNEKTTGITYYKSNSTTNITTNFNLLLILGD